MKGPCSPNFRSPSFHRRPGAAAQPAAQRRLAPFLALSGGPGTVAATGPLAQACRQGISESHPGRHADGSRFGSPFGTLPGLNDKWPGRKRVLVERTTGEEDSS